MVLNSSLLSIDLYVDYSFILLDRFSPGFGLKLKTSRLKNYPGKVLGKPHVGALFELFSGATQPLCVHQLGALKVSPFKFPRFAHKGFGDSVPFTIFGGTAIFSDERL